MRAIPLRCPNCGASLNAAAAAKTITCAYCQTTSRVRARTAFFETPVKLPQAPPQLANLPVAVQQHTRRWAVGCASSIAVFVGIMALIPFLIIHKVKSATSNNGVTGRTLMWQSGTPLAADVNGDGVADLLGRLQGLDGIKSVHLVAFDGATGKRLWRSPKLGQHEQVYQGVVALVDDRLLFVSPRGFVSSFMTADGSASWKLKLGEKLKSACRDDSGTFLVTADEKWVSIDPDTGKATQARPRAGCAPLQTDDSDEPVNVQVIDRWDRVTPVPPKFEGMAINLSLGIEGNQRLALGYKQPGTQVPMVARYAIENYNPPSEMDVLETPTDGLSPKERRELRRRQRAIEDKLRDAKKAVEFKLAWKTQIPSRDPLSAKSSRTEHYGISLEADCIVVPYEVTNKPIHVACVSYKTGKHRWDIVLPKAFIDSLYGVTVTANRAFVSMSSRVHILDLADGRRIGTVGQNN